MADKVIALVRPALKPDQDIVVVCRHLLQKAEAGEIRGIAVALDVADGDTETAIAFAEEFNVASLLLGIGLVQRRVMDSVIASQEGG